MSKPSVMLRMFLESHEMNYEWKQDLEAIERAIIRREGRYEGLVIGRDYKPVENDELSATKAHLEDMRRIVFEDKQ